MISKICTMLILVAIICGSCRGYIFKYQIIGDYYLFAVDTKYELAIFKKNSDDINYSEKIPSRVIEYGFANDKIIAKVSDWHHDSTVIEYFILDIASDINSAEKKDYLIGPLTENEFNKDWRSKLHVNLLKVKDLDASMGDN